MRQAINNIAFVAPGRPDLDRAFDLSAFAPFTLIRFDNSVALDPLCGALPVGKSVHALAGPLHRFLRLRVRVPNLATRFGVEHPAALSTSNFAHTEKSKSRKDGP